MVITCSMVRRRGGADLDFQHALKKDEKKKQAGSRRVDLRQG